MGVRFSTCGEDPEENRKKTDVYIVFSFFSTTEIVHFENRFLGVPARKIAAATPLDSEGG